MKLRNINTAIKRQLESPKAKRQQQDRRKESLFKKAYEYNIECDAEVFLGIRLKRNGQIFVFNSEKSREWLPTDGQMVSNLLFRSCTD
jgi:SRF-type transcription factor (DNA-binding and dimerisation domain)